MTVVPRLVPISRVNGARDGYFWIFDCTAAAVSLFHVCMPPWRIVEPEASARLGSSHPNMQASTRKTGDYQGPEFGPRRSALSAQTAHRCEPVPMTAPDQESVVQVRADSSPFSAETAIETNRGGRAATRSSWALKLRRRSLESKYRISRRNLAAIAIVPNGRFSRLRLGSSHPSIIGQGMARARLKVRENSKPQLHDQEEERNPVFLNSG